jgi:hypothetical protein
VSIELYETDVGTCSYPLASSSSGLLRLILSLFTPSAAASTSKPSVAMFSYGATPCAWTPMSWRMWSTKKKLGAGWEIVHGRKVNNTPPTDWGLPAHSTDGSTTSDDIHRTATAVLATWHQQTPRTVHQSPSPALCHLAQTAGPPHHSSTHSPTRPTGHSDKPDPRVRMIAN